MIHFPLHVLTTLAADGPASIEVPLTPSPLHWMIQGLATAGVVLLVLGILLCLYRMLRGPSLPDRVMATDVLTFQVVGLVLLMALVLRNTAFFDVMLVVAILGFVSTVAFSQYLGTNADQIINPDGDPSQESNA